MKRQTIFLVVQLFWICCYSQGEYKIKHGDWELTIFYDSIKNEYLELHPTKFEVINKVKGITQVGPLNNKDVYTEWVRGFEYDVRFEDVNFDGHIDFKIKSFRMAYMYPGFNYWVWDPDENQFEFNKGIPEILNAGFHKELGVVYSWGRVGMSEFYHELYEWEGDTLILTAKEYVSFPPTGMEDLSPYFSWEVLKGGEMRKYEKEIEWSDSLVTTNFHYDMDRLLILRGIKTSLSDTLRGLR